MANSNFSRRRTDALKFLSGISLDGTDYTPTQSFFATSKHGSSANGTILFGSLIVTDDAITEEVSNSELLLNKRTNATQLIKNGKCDNGDNSDANNLSVCNKKNVEDPKVTKSNLSHSTKSKKRKKKLHHSSTCSDSERHYGSSCESICPVITSRVKTKSLPCKAITELNGDLNSKFVKCVKDHKFHGERIIMVTKKCLPFLVCSFIPYESTDRNRADFHKEVLRKRHASRTRPLSTSGDACNPFDLFGIIKGEEGQEVSYGKLLVPTRSLKDYFEKKHSADISEDVANHAVGHNRHLLARTKVLTRKAGYKWCYSYEQGTQKGIVHLATSPPLPNSKENILMSSMLLYNPTLLDDPELIAGKHRTLLTFSSYVTSVIDYVRPCDLKKEINDKFKEKFPHIKLTLSKLRSIKKEMCKTLKSESGNEFLTIAQAFVYFEKLILKGLINKQNRKLCAAASLLLSAKLNDTKGDALKTLLERIENIFRINRKELFDSEFAVLVALEFSLHIPLSEVLPHYQRLLYES